MAVIVMRSKATRHHVRLTKCNRGYAVEIFPYPSNPSPIWRCASYGEARDVSARLAERFGLPVRDCNEPGLLERSQ